VFSGFRVSGFEIRVSIFGFRVSSEECHSLARLEPEERFSPKSFWIQVLGFGFREGEVVKAGRRGVGCRV
jgi:hypothetical protein